MTITKRLQRGAASSEPHDSECLLGQMVTVENERLRSLLREVVMLRSLLREVSAQRWECATEYGRCPDCDATFSEPHDSECLLGQIDAELEE